MSDFGPALGRALTGLVIFALLIGAGIGGLVVWLL